MNYGEDFIETYNAKFASICVNAKKQFESFYNTNYSFIKAKKVNIKPLVQEVESESKLIDVKRELYKTLESILKGSRSHYTSDITLSLINDEVYEAFTQFNESIKQNIDYGEFIRVFAKRKAIHDYFSFLENNNKELTKKFNSKKIGDFLTIVKNKRELHTLNNLNKKLKKKDESIYHLTQNEKMILLHVLLHEFKNSGLNSLSTEYFRILSLSSECLTEKDVQNANTNDNKYKYFYKGVNASDKPSFEKRKMIDELLKKLESVTNIEKFKRVLIRYKNSK